MKSQPAALACPLPLCGRDSGEGKRGSTLPRRIAVTPALSRCARDGGKALMSFARAVLASRPRCRGRCSALSARTRCAASLDERALAIWHTAVEYQFWHVLAVFAVAAARTRRCVEMRSLRRPVAFVAGIVLFCGSLYALALGGPRLVGVVTPFGGIGLVAGWFALAFHAWTLRTRLKSHSSPRFDAGELVLLRRGRRRQPDTTGTARESIDFLVGPRSRAGVERRLRPHGPRDARPAGRIDAAETTPGNLVPSKNHSHLALRYLFD